MMDRSDEILQDFSLEQIDQAADTLIAQKRMDAAAAEAARDLRESMARETILSAVRAILPEALGPYVSFIRWNDNWGAERSVCLGINTGAWGVRCDATFRAAADDRGFKNLHQIKYVALEPMLNLDYETGNYYVRTQALMEFDTLLAAIAASKACDWAGVRADVDNRNAFKGQNDLEYVPVDAPVDDLSVALQRCVQKYVREAMEA